MTVIILLRLTYRLYFIVQTIIWKSNYNLLQLQLLISVLLLHDINLICIYVTIIVGIKVYMLIYNSSVELIAIVFIQF